MKYVSDCIADLRFSGSDLANSDAEYIPYKIFRRILATKTTRSSLQIINNSIPVYQSWNNTYVNLYFACAREF